MDPSKHEQEPHSDENLYIKIGYRLNNPLRPLQSRRLKNDDDDRALNAEERWPSVGEKT